MKKVSWMTMTWLVLILMIHMKIPLARKREKVVVVPEGDQEVEVPPEVETVLEVEEAIRNDVLMLIIFPIPKNPSLASGVNQAENLTIHQVLMPHQEMHQNQVFPLNSQT